MFIVSPLSGYKYSTVFTASNTNSAETINISWNDGTFSNTSTATHTYSAQGKYTVLLGNCSATSVFNISVYNGGFLDNAINITYNTLSGYASCPTNFNINVSSIEPESTIILYSNGSKSIPYNSDRNFWSHLNPEWQFNDINGNPISQISLTGQPIYNISNQLLGYTALSTVSYIDDMPGHPNLFFTMDLKQCDTPINSRVYAGLSFTVSGLAPTKLLITADGINNINQIQWANQNIPYTISVFSNSACNNIMHYANGFLTKVIQCQVCNSVNNNTITQVICAINTNDQDCFPTGGYTINTFFIPASSIQANSITTNFDPNACNNIPLNEVEYTVTRNAPINMFLSATGFFNVNGTIYSLSGVSSPFNVYPLENVNDFYRKGEDKTVYDLMKQYMHFDLNNTPTFNSYLSAIAGPGDTLGKAYDKIQNINKDLSDIDICTIDSIENLAQSMDVVIDNYDLEFPEELGRLMNFFSIPLQKLIGTRCVCNTNFNCVNCTGKNICTICKFDKRSNVGNLILSNQNLTAGVTVLKKENGSDVYDFQPIYSQNGLIQYPLYTLTGIDISKYCFYIWDQTKQNNPIGGQIDFKNPNTTLSRDLISANQWYSDSGVIEEILNYTLTKNLIF